MHKNATEKRNNFFLQLTERWQDGQYLEVADYIAHHEIISERSNLIDFCVYLSKHLGLKELRVLQKLI